VEFFLVLFKLFLRIGDLLYLIGVLVKLELVKLLRLLLNLLLLLEVFLMQYFILGLHLGEGLLVHVDLRLH
jgi:hypothetical protein